MNFKPGDIVAIALYDYGKVLEVYKERVHVESFNHLTTKGTPVKAWFGNTQIVLITGKEKFLRQNLITYE